jgi:hypothetical protein
LYCEGEHRLEAGWPENWNQKRRMDFYHRMTMLGVIEDYIPSMACEIERLVLISPYRVDEGELYRYLESSNVLHRQFLDLLDQQHQHSVHCKRSLARLCPTEKNGCCIGIFWIFVFVAATLVTYLLTIPVRVSYRIRIWLVRRQIHPLFTGWLAKQGIRK